MSRADAAAPGGRATRPPAIELLQLGTRPYTETWRAMQAYTTRRDPSSSDQLWLLQHPPVYTQGQAGRPEHLLNPGTIPLVQSDRGGQVTYHGPGQVILYVLLDLQRRGLGVKALVRALEQAVIELLSGHDIRCGLRDGAPGVYCGDAKIASLGLRVRRGRSYHGLSLNVNMDLEPFSRINPCGYPDLRVTQVVDRGGPDDPLQVGRELAGIVTRRLQRRQSSALSSA